METATKHQPWTTQHAELGTGPAPIDPYISPAYFELERERIFRRVWLNVGRLEDIPQPGDYFVQDLAVGKTSILVVRGQDGTVRAFHNVCKHRGNKIVWDERGSCQRFACKFHGWTYAPDGRLIGVPEEEMFFDFKKSEHGLTRVATDICGGFIFIHLDPHPRETLSQYLGEAATVLTEFPFAELPVCYSYKAELKCNWRAARDSQLEAYHAKSLHARTVPDFFANADNPSLHTLDIKLYRRHSMLSGYGNRHQTPTPVEVLASQFGAMLSSEATGSFLERLPPSVLNPTRNPNWSFDLYYIFPNFHFLLFGGFCLTHHMWPLTVDRSVWEARLYLPQAENAAQWFSREYTRCVTRDVWLEDGSTLENVQRGLASGALSHTPLQDQELLIRHANKLAEDFIEDGER